MKTRNYVELGKEDIRTVVNTMYKSLDDEKTIVEEFNLNGQNFRVEISPRMYKAYEQSYNKYTSSFRYKWSDVRDTCELNTYVRCDELDCALHRMLENYPYNIANNL